MLVREGVASTPTADTLSAYACFSTYLICSFFCPFKFGWVINNTFPLCYKLRTHISMSLYKDIKLFSLFIYRMSFKLHLLWTMLGVNGKIEIQRSNQYLKTTKTKPSR